jgi:nucleoside-diphosphate-sugar epimerase
MVDSCAIDNISLVEADSTQEAQRLRRAVKCAITGANGYLGSVLATAFEHAGSTVFRLVRNPQQPNDVRFTLSEGVSADFFSTKKINALIHCAHDFQARTWETIYKQNVVGSVRLLETAYEQGVKKLVFISSMSAFEGCKSFYGRAKLEIEKEALRLGATVLRPGLIYGDNPGSMVGKLIESIKNRPIIPLIGNGKQVLYLTHEDDLSTLIFKICENDGPVIDGPIASAASSGKTFREILQTLARREQKTIALVPVPWHLPWLVLKLMEMSGLNPKFRSDSVVSLINQDVNPSFELTRKLGVAFREF